MSTAPLRSRGARRAVAISVLRTVVISSLVILGSSFTGDARNFGPGIAPFMVFFLILWASIVTGYLIWQVRAIKRSAYPEVRALETLVTGGIMMLAVFAKAYLLISVADPSAFNEELNSFTTYYFTVTVLGTVGFGDITPVSVLARSVAMTQMLFDIALLAVFVRIVAGAVKTSRSHQAD
ncbi:MAG: potassium channel family protein [Candidatus Nanopelagicales bacterium]